MVVRSQLATAVFFVTVWLIASSAKQVEAQRSPHTLLREYTHIILARWRFARSPQAISGGNLDEVCAGTTGSWCRDFHQQQPYVSKVWRPGRRRCHGGCNGVGICNFDLGICDCPAGWGGKDCKTLQKRPCTNQHREHGLEPMGAPENSSVPGWTASRCAGLCDEDVAACYCNGTLGRIPALAGSPPGVAQYLDSTLRGRMCTGTPPIRQGRPMILDACQPSLDDYGRRNKVGRVEPSKLFGPQGWCEAEKPVYECECYLDGLSGTLCEEVTEQACPNQCSGHGDCKSGFCMCHKGFYGHDCARHASGADLHWKPPPWVEEVSTNAVNESQHPMLKRRPLVYVYDLPSIFNSRMLQYRIDKTTCFWRNYAEGNNSLTSKQGYNIDSLFHEQMLQSPHRTLDPEEADFFYAPVYTSCLIYPVLGWADTPFFYGAGGPRVMHASRMLGQAKGWIQNSLPYWNRTGGRDHIWLVSHDEASCWVPSELRPSTILSHWGRKDLTHVSNTAYVADNYSLEFRHDEWSPYGWQHEIAGHACYDPVKDLVIPTATPALMGASPLLGFPTQERVYLLFFRGDVGRWRSPNYSRGIRQRLHYLAHAHRWKERHKIIVAANRTDAPGDYSQMLSASTFCLVVPGDGYSTRAEDAMLHGCIPVVIMDNVDPVFATLLDYSQFSVRIAEADVDHLPSILSAISDEDVRKLQEGVERVWQRFLYRSFKAFPAVLNDRRTLKHYQEHWEGRHNNTAWLPHTVDVLGEDDAFATIMQWLHSRRRLRADKW